MNWLTKLERKIGRFAVKNLMLYIIVLYAMGIVINMINPSIYFQALSLDVERVLHGEVWRLVTFMVYPPSGNFVFSIIMGYMFYSIGITLERIWGTFKFNVYFISGILFHILGAFIVYFIWHNSNMYITTEYLNWSLFFAFAVTFPDMQFLLFFLIPVKAKVLGIIDAVLFAVSFVMAVASGNYATAFIIIMCILNFLIFFLSTRNQPWASPKVMTQKVKFKREMSNARSKSWQTRHKCAVCGQTELDNPSLEFRYCSKCAGGKEYCLEHLYTHIHVGNDNK